VIINEIKAKPCIDYPCRWVYKVIGGDREELRRAIAALLQDLDHSIAFSHSSAGGKYHSFNVEVTVECEEKRLAVYEALKAEPAVKIIL
jgi:putative lipoic acid-binding regulatory protein